MMLACPVFNVTPLTQREEALDHFGFWVYVALMINRVHCCVLYIVLSVHVYVNSALITGIDVFASAEKEKESQAG